MTVPSSSSRRQPAILALVATAVLAGCAAPNTAGTSPRVTTVPAGASTGIELGTPTAGAATGDDGSTSGPVAGGADPGSASMTAWDPVVIDTAVPVGPENVCAGVDQTTAEFTRLGADDQVGEIVVCGAGVGYLPGDGTWNLISEHRVPAAELPVLADGLRRADVVVPPDTACTAMLVMVPTFTVVTTDGRRLKGSVPSDGCHPQQDLVDALTQVVTEQPAEKRWRTTQIETDTTLTTGCAAQAAAIPWPPTLPPTGAATAAPPVQWPVPDDGAADGAAVCRYGTPATVDNPAATAGSPEPDGTDPSAASDAPTAANPGDDGASGAGSTGDAGSPIDVGPGRIEPAAPPSGGFPGAGAPLLGTGRIDAATRDRLIASIASDPPTDRPGCGAADPWTDAADGTGQLVLATAPTRTAGGVPQAGYPYLVLETGPCARVLADGGYTLAGWADPQIVQQVRAAVDG